VGGSGRTVSDQKLEWRYGLAICTVFTFCQNEVSWSSSMDPPHPLSVWIESSLIRLFVVNANKLKQKSERLAGKFKYSHPILSLNW